MTQLLQRALEQAAALPEDDQDFLAEMIFEAIQSDQKWDELFADPRSEKVLEQLGAEALAEYRAGLTVDLDEVLDALDHDGQFSQEAGRTSQEHPVARAA